MKIIRRITTTTMAANTRQWHQRSNCCAGFFLIVIVFALSIQSFGLQESDDLKTSFSIPDQTKQVIVVTSTDWTTTQALLQRYERSDKGWKRIGTQVKVSLGKNGLAWGRGLHKKMAGLEKKEGDAKAPAGVFSLGTMFGYGESSPSALRYPYRQSTPRDYFVDDVNSKDYNQWVTIPADKENNSKQYWASVEKMKRSDHLYEYGIVINHNSDPVEKGKGSAIFFHIWRTPGAGTLGCTSMSKDDLLQLMGWLDPEKKPLLIQVPVAELSNL